MIADYSVDISPNIVDIKLTNTDYSIKINMSDRDKVKKIVGLMQKINEFFDSNLSEDEACDKFEPLIKEVYGENCIRDVFGAEHACFNDLCMLVFKIANVTATIRGDLNGDLNNTIQSEINSNKYLKKSKIKV